MRGCGVWANMQGSAMLAFPTAGGEVLAKPQALVYWLRSFYALKLSGWQPPLRV